MTRSAYEEKIALAGWILLILAVGILPLRNFVGHSHWEYIKWVPTVDDLRSAKYLLDIGSDLIGNTLLFFPLGYLLSRRLPTSGHRRVIHAMAVGGLLSLGIEWYQVYCHFRFPSIFDLLTNTTGTALGASFEMGILPGVRRQAAAIPSLPDRSPAPSNNE